MIDIALIQEPVSPLSIATIIFLKEADLELLGQEWQRPCSIQAFSAIIYRQPVGQGSLSIELH